MIYCSYINSQQFKVFYVLFFYWCFVVVVFLADEVKLFKVKRNLDAGGFRQFIRAIYPELRNNMSSAKLTGTGWWSPWLKVRQKRSVQAKCWDAQLYMFVRWWVIIFSIKKISVVAILQFVFVFHSVKLKRTQTAASQWTW